MLTGRVSDIVKRPSTWIILAIFVILTLIHYSNLIEQPGFLADITSRLGLQRHVWERIAYMIPVIYSGYLYGRKASFTISLVALLCMLPRALFYSPYPADACVETAAVFILGNAVALSLDSLHRERDQRSQLEWARKALTYQLQVVRENESRLAALNRASETLFQSLDTAQILDRAAGIAMELMQGEAVSIHIIDEASQRVVLAKHSGITALLEQSLSAVEVGRDYIGMVAKNGEPISVENVQQDQSITDSALKKTTIQSLLCVPVKSKGKTTGTLSILMYSPRWFQEYEVELLSAIGNQVGVALDNARMYESGHPQ